MTNQKNTNDYDDVVAGIHLSDIHSNEELTDILNRMVKSMDFIEASQLLDAYKEGRIKDVQPDPNTKDNDIISYLSKFKEEMPSWLLNYKKDMPVSFLDIMSSRVGYYPGSGFDGMLIKVGNKSHSVHSFLYVDYLISKDKMVSHLSEPGCILGYHSIGRIEWQENDLMPIGQYPLNIDKKPISKLSFVDPSIKPYCFTEIMERDADRHEDWGAQRFAVTFLFADGIATYYQLFCKEYNKGPWIMLLQDHGFGGNYDKFGKDGLLDAIIMRNDIRPHYVLCAENTQIWQGYERVSGLQPINEGLHSRFLYKNFYL